MALFPFRKDFPALENFTSYLNTPATGLISSTTAEAAKKSYQALLEQGAAYSDTFYADVYPEFTALAGKYFGVEPSNLAVIPSFSHGFNMLISGLKKGSRILCLSKDYPSLSVPISLGEFTLERINPEANGFYLEEEIIARINEIKPEYFIYSQVQYNSGQFIGSEKLHQQAALSGTKLIVDATQSAGVVPLDFNSSPFQAVLFSTYKWCNAGFGLGLMMLKNDFLKKHSFKTGGFGSGTWEAGEFNLEKGMPQFRPAHKNKPAIEAFMSVLKERASWGQQSIFDHAKSLLGEFLANCNQRILGTGNVQDYGSFCCLTDKDGELSTRLKHSNISHTYRNGLVRLGFHFYNSEEDLSLLLKALN